MPQTAERFLARQAILDRNQGVIGYELLFRNSLANYFPTMDGDTATDNVLADSFLVFGIEELTGPAKAFVKFTRGLLCEGRALLFPQDKVVVEILESGDPEPGLLAACRQLKSQGYTLVLDELAADWQDEPLLGVVDIVKVDFRQTVAPARARLADALHRRRVIPLAEKVETPEEHLEAMDHGYELFQGYFFHRPALLTRRDLSPQKAHYLRLLQELNVAEPDLDDLARIIQADVALSLKLLRYINSAAVGLRRPIASIKEALWVMGEREMRRWANLLAMTELSSGKPSELLRTALFRARFAELLALRTGSGPRASDFFLLGLFSLLDAMLDRPIEETLSGMPLTADLQEALLGSPEGMGQVLQLVVAQERGDWLGLEASAAHLDLDENELPAMQVEAIRFADEIWRATVWEGGGNDRF